MRQAIQQDRPQEGLTINIEFDEVDADDTEQRRLMGLAFKALRPRLCQRLANLIVKPGGYFHGCFGLKDGFNSELCVFYKFSQGQTERALYVLIAPAYSDIMSDEQREM